eukprot:12654955-Prorocentrum_lima.AAC.1
MFIAGEDRVRLPPGPGERDCIDVDAAPKLQVALQRQGMTRARCQVYHATLEPGELRLPGMRPACARPTLD